MKPLKVIVEKHPDGYIAYPLGLKGVIIGQGDTYEAPWHMSGRPSIFILKPLDRKFWRLTLRFSKRLSLKLQLKPRDEVSE